MNDTEKTYGIEDALKGGPGLDGYSFQADVYCIPCGRNIARAALPAGVKVSWIEFCDGERVPQPIFFGESPDCAQHCGGCGEYLYGSDPEIS